jgi:ribosomal protein S18 acetylase RimI-like enzyme
VLRPATRADRGAILALGVAEEEAWFGAAESSAAEVGEWIDEECDLAAGAVLCDAADRARVRAFAAPALHGICILMAEPSVVSGALDLLIPWLRDRGAVEVMTFGSDGERVAGLERNGLRHIRSSFTLARSARSPVPALPDWPPGIEVAPYALGADDGSVHRLIYVDAAWSSVPGHVDRDLDAWRNAVRPGLRAFLARREGVPVGWVAGRLLEAGRGYISGLAVARGARGVGLGRALLLHSCADLLAGGASDLGLDVVATNDSALGLYRSVGFDVEREWRIYADPPTPQLELVG